MTEKEFIKHLKIALLEHSAKYRPDPDSTERVRQVVMIRIGQMQAQSAPKAVNPVGYWIGFLRYIMPPRFAYALGVFVLLAGAGVVAAASRGALPGDSLYGAKIAFEKAQVRLVSNPAERAQVQMDLAGKRLQEVQAITKHSESNGRVEEVLNRFAKDVQEATETLKQAADPVQIKAAAQGITKKAEQYKQELAETKQILTEKPSSDVPEIPTAPTVVEPAPSEPVEVPVTTLEEEPQEPTQAPEFTVTPGKRPAREVGLASIEQAEKLLDEVKEALEKTDTVDN